MKLFFQEFFKDETIAEQILQATTPTECKRFGRLVTGFECDVWKENRTPIVFEALTAKVLELDSMKIICKISILVYTRSAHESSASQTSRSSLGRSCS